MTRISRSRAAIHILFWISVFLLMSLNHIRAAVSSVELLLKAVVVIVLLLGPVYFHLSAFERYFSAKRYWIYSLSLLCAVVSFVIMRNVVYVVFFKAEPNITGSIYFIMTYLLITTALKLGKEGYEQRLAFQEMRARHVETELEMLKTQINPHFLFNTLNNLFGIAIKSDEKVAAGIARLSRLMRYMMDETGDEKVALSKEIEQIECLMELHRLRFSEDDDIDIDLEVKGDIDDVMIPPMILVTFVENALKHGIVLDAPSFVEVRLKVAGSTLEFSVTNSLHVVRRDKTGSDAGSGLKNSRRRLDLLYPGSHHLSIGDSGGEFKVTLRVDL
ncbi:MAG TPA: sensor histidine kinase [Candidatus Krumholzibacterium sp.]|nr:sensor histidine kinase [Candidatus Krumholzibacterium sp.]